MGTMNNRSAWTHSIRFRLTAWFTGALAIILVAMCLSIYLAARHALRVETDAFLRGEAQYLAAASASEASEKDSLAELIDSVSPPSLARAEPGKSDGFPVRARQFLAFDVVYVRLVSQTTHATIAASPSLKGATKFVHAFDEVSHDYSDKDGPVISYVAPTEEDALRVLTQPVGSGNQHLLIQVGTPWDHDEDILDHLTVVLTGVLFVILCAVATGGWILVGRALQPINRVVSEARRLDTREIPTQLLPPPMETDSEIGQLVETLNQMTTRLHDAFEVERRFGEAQQRFAADASHELRTPLTVLRSGMELALSRPRTIEDYRKTMQQGVEEIERMSRIVEALSFIARYDAKQMTSPLEMHKVDVADLASRTAAGFIELARERNITIRCETTLSKVVLVSADEVQLQQLVGNLIQNAIKYNIDGGKVVVRVEMAAKEDASQCVVIVEDTGIGIAEENLPHVFERFWRADTARTTGGSGLGLAICQRIAKEHGGTLTVESKLGIGSVARLTLPIATSAPHAKQASAHD
jgi:signal transduction histidine kinase